MGMKKNNNRFNRNRTRLTIDYRALGTINLDEFLHAVMVDTQALKDIYNIRFVTAPRLWIFPTNEYGESIKVIRPTGGVIEFMDTHYYRPACKDYDL